MEITTKNIEKEFKMIFPLLFEDLTTIIIGGGNGFVIPIAYTYYQKLNGNLELIEQISNIRETPTLAQIQIGNEFYNIANSVAQRNELDLIDLNLENKTKYSGGLVKLFAKDSSISSLGIGKLKLNELSSEITRMKDSIYEIEIRMAYQRI